MSKTFKSLVTIGLLSISTSTMALEFMLKSRGCRLVTASTKFNGIKSNASGNRLTGKCIVSDKNASCSFSSKSSSSKKSKDDLDIVSKTDEIVVMENADGMVISVDLKKRRYISKKEVSSTAKKMSTLLCAGVVRNIRD